MKFQEYFYPTINWKPSGEYSYLPRTDYAEIELVPDENDIELLENLERYSSRKDFTKEELSELDNPESDKYEQIIAYVHFLSETGELNRINYCVVTGCTSDEIKINLDVISKMELITKARQSIEKWRNTDKVIRGDL